MRLVNPATTTK